MTQPSPTQPTAALDITTANIERELLQASMTQPVLVLFWTPRSNGSRDPGGCFAAQPARRAVWVRRIVGVCGGSGSLMR